jgi:hypothetical protein
VRFSRAAIALVTLVSATSAVRVAGQAAPADSSLLSAAVTLNVTNAPLERVLREISRQVGGRLAYDNTLFHRGDPPITYECVNSPLRDVLSSILKTLPISFGLSKDGGTVLLRRTDTTALDSASVVIDGRVLRPDSTAAVSAFVVVTEVGSKLRRDARTDSLGVYRVTMSVDTMGYVVSALMVGWQRQQIAILYDRGERIHVPTIFLRALGKANLNSVTIEAPGAGPPPTESTTDTSASGNTAAEGMPITSDHIRNPIGASFNDILSRLAGVRTSAEGFSVLGSGTSENAVVLNGLRILGTGLPAYLSSMGRLTTAVYDASRGGFSGGELSFDMQQYRHSYWRPFFNATFEAPTLQSTDAPSPWLNGVTYRSIALMASVEGPLTRGSNGWSLSIQLDVTRRSTGAPSLLNADSHSFVASGVLPDSVTRFLQALSSNGIPSPARRSAQVTNVMRSLVSLGHVADTNHVLGIIGTFDAERGDALAGSVTALPGGTSRSRAHTYNLQFTSLDKFGNRFLNSFVAGAGTEARSYDPDLVGLSAQTLIGSTLQGQDVSFATLHFGSAGASHNRITRLINLKDELSWKTYDRAHRLKVSLDGYNEHVDLRSSANRFGTYFYNSLASLSANAPALFTRTIGEATTDVEIRHLGGSLGDVWSIMPRLRLIYSARVDATSPKARMESDAAADSLFHISTRGLSTITTASPRIGIDWLYGTKLYPLPPGGFALGLGDFTSATSAMELGSLSLGGGSLQHLACAGPAVPTPNWSEFLANPSSSPAQCADGSAGSPFALGTPNITTLAEPFHSPRRRSITGRWRSTQFSPLNMTLALRAAFFKTLEQRGRVDLNFDNTERFSLADEGGRPVYVPANAIAASSGTATIAANRRFADYGQVWSYDAHARTTGRELSFETTLQPLPSTWPITTPRGFHVVYVNTKTVQHGNGFDGFGTTGSDPLVVERARGSVPGHDIVLETSFYSTARDPLDSDSKLGTLHFRLSFTSGVRYSPMIAGDVNGDGQWNDRAFVFDPSHTADSALAAAMGHLVTASPQRVRKCLLREIGRIASPNSCTGSWSQALTLAYTTQPPGSAFFYWVYVENVLAGVDQLIHRRGMERGWGQLQFPDQTLLQVTGFDQARSRYTYAVNSHFGSPRQTVFRDPFRVTIRVQYTAGGRFRPMEAIDLVGFDGQNKTTMLPRDSVFERVRNKMLMPPYWSPLWRVVREQDSLFLTDTQLERLNTAYKANMRWVDSVSDRITSTLIRTKGKQSLDSIARELGWEQYSAIGHAKTMEELALIREVLAPEQWAIYDSDGFWKDKMKRDAAWRKRKWPAWPRLNRSN